MRTWALQLACAWLACGLPAWAGSEPAFRLERAEDGLYLTARVALALQPGLEDVLQRGVPVHFVWQAELRRPRWYWADQRLGTATRVARVVYQPLTRRWRVSVGSGPVVEAGLGSALHQNLERLDEALAAVSRVTRWRVADAAQLSDAGQERLDVQFRLDTGLLPRPFLLGTAGPGPDAPVHRQTLTVPAADPTGPRAATE
ncbi:DUF4390 domain-containing protein [Aquabacterium sp. A08]|uniref:DUF4390 domain-containing protein n=1 Tax=Aquabacterium sp. A08 TaxID=2718532 RepID=UPI001424592E|nr:DUF4390 domain-containing protein [Aquabacterium sp. A08]